MYLPSYYGEWFDTSIQFLVLINFDVAKKFEVNANVQNIRRIKEEKQHQQLTLNVDR